MKSETQILKEIGARLTQLRIKQGYTSYEGFAMDNDLSRMHYWRVEKGKVNLTVKSLTKILNIHRISIEDFFRIKVK